jgi:peptidylprolyl isomerase
MCGMTKIAATALALLALAGCGSETKTASIPSGSGDAAETTETTPTETEAAPAPKTVKATPEVNRLAAAAGKDTKKKPKIGKPKGDPPEGLVIKDIVMGSGPAAKSGDQVEVDYAGTSWSTGKEFDASWNNKQTFPFQLGQGGVISGWDEGVPGMKKGGRRMLVIPPDQAYGAQGSPPAIGPNETLIFVIDLRKIG